MGGAWFLYDVALYGTTLLGPTIVEDCFRGKNSIQDTSWQQLVGLSFNVPAMLLSVELLNRQRITAKKTANRGLFADGLRLRSVWCVKCVTGQRVGPLRGLLLPEF